MIVPTSADPTTWGLRNVHDPTVVRCNDGTYVMFSTDAWASGRAPAGVHMRTSSDLVHWQWMGTALGAVPEEAFAHTGAAGLWAPEVVRWPTPDGTELWRMFYSASSFGSRTSAIGSAIAPDPRGPWTPEHVVVKTSHDESPHNAIDAAVIWDESGRPWLTYGSFFAGIYTLELDKATALPLQHNAPGTLLANRPASVDGAIEGAYLLNHTESPERRFVAFVSFDSLVNNYSIRVAASHTLTGPYIDADGAPLISAGSEHEELSAKPDHHGTPLLAGHHFLSDKAQDFNSLIAPGHNSVFESSDGSFIVHHVRFGSAPHEHVGQIRRLYWLSSGWPVIAPFPFRGETVDYAEELSDVRFTGTWHVVDFRNTPTQIPVETPQGVPPRVAPCTTSENLLCTGDLAEFGVEQAATFEVFLPRDQGWVRTLGFSGLARAASASDRLTAIFGYLEPEPDTPQPLTTTLQSAPQENQ